MDGQCQANLCYSTTHSLLHFELFKVATVSRIPYVSVVVRVLSTKFDIGCGFINELYEQSIFWINGCLNASFIIYCLACNYCLKQTKRCNMDYRQNNLALQYMI